MGVLHTDFCATSQSMCILEGICSFLPLLIYIVLGIKSMQACKNKNPYIRSKYTQRHLIKLVLSSTIAITCIVFVIIYPIVEDLISLKTEIAWSLSCFLWFFNAFLIRNEYTSLGYTTLYLRAAWLVILIGQTILLMIGQSDNNDDSFEEVSAIYYVNEVTILFIVVFGILYPDDNPPQKIRNPLRDSFGEEEKLKIDESSYNNIDASLRKNNNNNYVPYPGAQSNSDMDSTFKQSPIIDALNNSSDSSKRPRRTSRSRFEEDASTSQPTFGDMSQDESLRFSSTPGPNATGGLIKPDALGIQSIEIVADEEATRANKKTTLYVIEYYIDGMKYITRRSYSEFRYLYKQIQKTKPEEKLPELPPKKPMNKDRETINERKEMFNDLLQFLLDKQIGSSYLSEILTSDKNLPYYGKIGDKNDASWLSVPNNSVVSGRSNILNNSLTNESKLLDSSFEGDLPSLKGSNASSFSENPMIRASQNKSLSQSLAYNPVKSYKVQTVGVTSIDNAIVRDGLGVDWYASQDSQHYKLNVTNTSTLIEEHCLKRYSDFKVLHQEIKRRVKKNERDIIPSLPYKGSVGITFNRKDPKIIEFRKEALRDYLEKLLNSSKLQDIPFLQEFIRTRKEAIK